MRFHLHEISRSANSERQKVDETLPRAGGEKNGTYCLMGTKFLFRVMEKF